MILFLTMLILLVLGIYVAVVPLDSEPVTTPQQISPGLTAWPWPIQAGSMPNTALGTVDGRNSASTKTLWEGQSIASALLLPNLNFDIRLSGLMGGDAAVDNSVVLAWVYDDGTTPVTLATITITNAPATTDLPFFLEFMGRVISAGASGAIAANGWYRSGQASVNEVFASSALAGVTVNTTKSGRLRIQNTVNAAASGAGLAVNAAVSHIAGVR